MMSLLIEKNSPPFAKAKENAPHRIQNVLSNGEWKSCIFKHNFFSNFRVFILFTFEKQECN